jgi:ADP-ribose pyrophosphatase YjhB (NUDIX family)
MKQTHKTLQVGVKIIISDETGRILLLKRSGSKYKDANGTWTIPGGRINAGAKLVDNLKREVLEETNLQLIPYSLKLITAQDILLNDKHVVRLTYTGKATGAVSLNDGEHDQFSWMPAKQALAELNLDTYLKEVLTTMS